MLQSTLANAVRATGVGVHSGQVAKLMLRPAPENTGIVFIRHDLPGAPSVLAHVNHVVDTRMCTTLGVGEATVATVEHLLSALAGLGIDNAYIDINGPEVPVMDGSASPFVFLIQAAGVKVQSAERRMIRILKPVEVQEGDRIARFEPADESRYSMRIDFAHPVIRATEQTIQFTLSHPQHYAVAVARARTFGFLEDYERLKAQKLALGGSLSNAVILDSESLINPEGLRFVDEFVRHKLLDAIGDLYLLGAPVLGHFYGEKSGHYLNYLLMKTLLRQVDAWEWTFAPAERMDERA